MKTLMLLSFKRGQKMPTDYGRKAKLLREQYAETERREREAARQASEQKLNGLYRRIGERLERHAETLREIREPKQ
jgi:hypothetical protein